MKKILVVLGALTAFVVLCSHDMFLKLDTYKLQPNTKAILQLFNGTYEKSDNIIDRNRMLDVSLVGNGERTALDSSNWFEKNNTTFLNFKTGNEGTYVAGLSTAPRDIVLKAEDFNTYLKNDGVLEVLENRIKTNTLDRDAVEKYAKHVKAIFQVGDQLTNDWNVHLGYPLEFIPLQNPYDIHSGHNLEVRLLFRGEPLKNHFVYVGTETETNNNETSHTHDGEVAHSHSHDNTGDSNHQHSATQQLKTNGEGIVSIEINTQGNWYLKTIKMIESEEPKLTHESNWATLTFGIGAGHNAAHSHDQDTHEHEHSADSHTHDESTHTHDTHPDDDFPTYILWIGSFVLIGLLFFWFNRKK
jgi:uncharacterized GH25 family protein